MKKLIYILLSSFFGKKKFYRFFLVLKNIGLEGMNFRSTDIKTNGELFLITEITKYYEKKNNLVIFDVGANIGNYSKVLADTFKSKALIYSFEPFSVPYMELKKMCEKYPSVKPIKLGFSDKNEELILYTSDEFSEVGGIYNRSASLEGVVLDKTESNQFDTISSFAEKNKIDTIHFLKIDVEGHELAVLKGAHDFIKQDKIDFIQFEFGSGNHFSKTFFIDFYSILSPNYHLYQLLKDGLYEIRAYSTDLEIITLCNIVAVRKNLKPNFL